MTERLPELAAALDRLVPSFAEVEPRWETIAPRRHSLPARKQGAALLAACLLALFALLPGLGLGRSLFWPGFDAAEPRHELVAAGRLASGERWQLRAWRGGGARICFELVVLRRPAAKNCGRGLGGGSRSARPRWISYLSYTSLEPRFQFLCGPAAAGVSRIEFSLADGSSLPANLVGAASSTALASGLRFYFTELPAGAQVSAISAYDGRGRRLERLQLRLRRA